MIKGDISHPRRPREQRQENSTQNQFPSLLAALYYNSICKFQSDKNAAQVKFMQPLVKIISIV